LKVYLSVPIIANRSLDRARLIAEVIVSAGHEVTSPWVLDAPEADRPSVSDVFQRDTHGAESSDAIVADVTEPSIGVGMEIMAAHKAGKRVILVMRKGRAASRMLMHMQPKDVVEYHDDPSLITNLSSVLSDRTNLK